MTMRPRKVRSLFLYGGGFSFPPFHSWASLRRKDILLQVILNPVARVWHAEAPGPCRVSLTLESIGLTIHRKEVVTPLYSTKMLIWGSLQSNNTICA